MTEDILVERARSARRSPAVLKLKIGSLRSRFTDHIIFVVEGKTDYSPYEVWLNFSQLSFEWRIQTSEGKDQVLGLREMLSRDENGLSKGIYYVVDSDYDGLKGFSAGGDIYATDCYSVENYLVSREVVAS